MLALAALLLVSAAPPTAGSSAETLYKDGVAARYAGDTPRALALLQQAVAAEPANADAQLQLGLALMAAHRLDDAEAALRRTLALAPDYQDAKDALQRIAEQRAGTRIELEPARATGIGVAGEHGASQPAAAAPLLDYRWEMNVDGSYSALEGGRDWQEGSLQLRYKAGEATTVGGTVEVSRRFGRTDTYGELRIDQRVGTGGSFYLSAGGTPDADFRPEWQIGAGGSLRLRSGPSATVLTLDGRQARYRSGDIQTLTPGIEQYVFGGRAWLTARWINIFDENGEHQSGWLARGDVMASERVRLFAGIADAPDTSEGVVIDTFSLFGGASVDLNDRTTFRLSLAHEDRAFGSDRLQLGVGLGLRF
jgi:YaiO family outer membrane protein